jgi:hypothetical protein
VRHTVRPFIKEFKTRSAKSSATHPRPLGDTDNDGSKLSFLDLNVFTTRQNKFEVEHKEALTAAAAVFGEGSPVAPLPKASPLSNAPVGRVLPSHIGEDDLLTVRLTEGDGKSRSGRRVGKVKSSSPIRLKKPTRQLESAVARVFLERPATSFSQDILIVSAPRRDRRSIQKRWVLRTELKAGEKWKRRLCKAARWPARNPFRQATGART